MPTEPMNVIDRLKEQLKLAGKVRGFKQPIYREIAKGKKELVHYARQHITVQSADILELCEQLNPDDEIVQAQQKGHAFAATTPEAKATMLADDVFYLIELAERRRIVDQEPVFAQ